jgi:hypothetical protein
VLWLLPSPVPGLRELPQKAGGTGPYDGGPHPAAPGPQPEPVPALAPAPESAPDPGRQEPHAVQP